MVFVPAAWVCASRMEPMEHSIWITSANAASAREWTWITSRMNGLGKITSYLIDDRGEDRLGRVDFRRNLKPPEDLRGRFSWVNREFMPYNWQVTTGIDYESDENFLESYRRHEYNTGPDRETYIHLKRIEDNWGLAFLAKGRINNFADELDEAPTGEYHLTGQSIFDDKMTLYSDTYGGRYRQQIGKNHTTVMDEEAFRVWHAPDRG